MGPQSKTFPCRLPQDYHTRLSYESSTDLSYHRKLDMSTQPFYQAALSRVVSIRDLDLAVTDGTACADHLKDLKGACSGVQGSGMLLSKSVVGRAGTW